MVDGVNGSALAISINEANNLCAVRKPECTANRATSGYSTLLLLKANGSPPLGAKANLFGKGDEFRYEKDSVFRSLQLHRKPDNSGHRTLLRNRLRIAPGVPSRCQ